MFEKVLEVEDAADARAVSIKVPSVKDDAADPLPLNTRLEPALPFTEVKTCAEFDAFEFRTDIFTTKSV
jgi:hypothetical protein